MTVLLNTVGLIAVWDNSDQWHRAAHACFVELLAAKEELVSTTFILGECGNAAARRPYRDAVCRLREKLENSKRLIVPTEDDWREAWIAYRAGEPDAAGIVDHISFVVMRRLGISKAFTNDLHFRTAGFEVLF